MHNAIGQTTTDHPVFKPHHTLGIAIGHTQISRGVQADGNKKRLALPNWAINYNYKFHPKWAIGLHNDIIFEDFEVEEHLRSSDTTVILKRSYPVASAVTGSFKPGKHVSFLLGIGGEFSHAGNLWLWRAGAEYSYHMNKNWELTAAFVNDFKIKAYNSYSISMGVARKL
jgi:hypothetical protein